LHIATAFGATCTALAATAFPARTLHALLFEARTLAGVVAAACFVAPFDAAFFFEALPPLPWLFTPGALGLRIALGFGPGAFLTALPALTRRRTVFAVGIAG
jgi:hypothetical protein